MNVAAGPDLAAAVSNAGGLGVIGGLGYTCVGSPCTALESPLTSGRSIYGGSSKTSSRHSTRPTCVSTGAHLLRMR